MPDCVLHLLAVDLWQMHHHFQILVAEAQLRHRRRRGIVRPCRDGLSDAHWTTQKAARARASITPGCACVKTGNRHHTHTAQQQETREAASALLLFGLTAAVKGPSLSVT